VETGWDEAFAVLEQRLRRSAPPTRNDSHCSRRDQIRTDRPVPRQFVRPTMRRTRLLLGEHGCRNDLHHRGSFWEFAARTDRAKLFVMIGTARTIIPTPEDGPVKFKRDGGASFRSTRSARLLAIAENGPIRPGTDGACCSPDPRNHLLGLYDREFLVRCTNAGQLVNTQESNDEFACSSAPNA